MPTLIAGAAEFIGVRAAPRLLGVDHTLARIDHLNDSVDVMLEAAREALAS
ncbi:MAG TPA: hypothetical protein VHB25_12020 [Gemmatimonadaceae bacterium]|nr:hypothetical protein [Gemmatimonadaceae bacterium]